MPRYSESRADLAAPETMARLSGLEFMNAMLSGETPAPPIARTLGFDLIAVEEGRVIFEGAPSFSVLNPMGGVHGGWFGALLDSALGCAVMTTLPAGRLYTTLEFRVQILKGLTEDSGAVRAIGEARRVGRRTGFAEARMESADGSLVALGSATCLVFEAPGAAREPRS